MSEKFRVRLEKEQHVFSAAHFITFAGDICERLHGHNYGVAVEVSGPLDENQYVVDFILLRDTLKEITADLDHRVILPDRHPLIRVKQEGREVVATFRDRRWIFPMDDCAILPIANTTAELLARHIGVQLKERLKTERGIAIPKLVVEVDENYGQWGIWEFDES